MVRLVSFFKLEIQFCQLIISVRENEFIARQQEAREPPPFGVKLYVWADTPAQRHEKKVWCARERQRGGAQAHNLSHFQIEYSTVQKF